MAVVILHVNKHEIGYYSMLLRGVGIHILGKPVSSLWIEKYKFSPTSKPQIWFNINLNIHNGCTKKKEDSKSDHSIMSLSLYYVKLKLTQGLRTGSICWKTSRFIIPIVKPTRCTNVSNLFYFRTTLCVFRTVFPSTLSSSRLYIQLSNRYCCVLASKQTAVLK